VAPSRLEGECSRASGPAICPARQRLPGPWGGGQTPNPSLGGCVSWSGFETFRWHGNGRVGDHLGGWGVRYRSGCWAGSGFSLWPFHTARGCSPKRRWDGGSRGLDPIRNVAGQGRGAGGKPRSRSGRRTGVVKKMWSTFGFLGGKNWLLGRDDFSAGCFFGFVFNARSMGGPGPKVFSVLAMPGAWARAYKTFHGVGGLGKNLWLAAWPAVGLGPWARGGRPQSAGGHLLGRKGRGKKNVSTCEVRRPVFGIEKKAAIR